VGAGHWGKNLIRVFHKLGALSAICDLDPNTREQTAQVYRGVPILASLDQVLAKSEINAVVLAVPAVQHYDMARTALLAGRDVLVEKPLALSVEAWP